MPPYHEQALLFNFNCFPNQMKNIGIMQVEALKKNHPLNGFYNYFFNKFNDPKHLCESLILSAEYLYQIVQEDEPGAVLFFGRSGCLLKVGYDQICTYFTKENIIKENKHPSVHLSFSGHPDRDIERDNGFSKQNPDIVRIRNMVNQDKLDHFFNYIDSQNIKDYKKIYIVDILGLGAGLNSFLDILTLYFKARELEMPKLEFMHASSTTTQTHCALHKKGFISFEPDLESFNKGVISFKKDLQSNIKPMSISTRTILVNPLVEKCLLDQNFLQTDGVCGIEYPAQKWTKEYDEQREKGGKWHKEIYDYLGRQVDNIVNFHFTKYYKN